MSKRGLAAVLAFWGWLIVILLIGFTLSWNAAVVFCFGTIIVVCLSAIVYGFAA